MPYDRGATSMGRFKLCHECAHEYGAPDDRRFHAQTNACPECGPMLWCCDSSGRVVARQREAVAIACQAIQNGQLVALKGIGGYLLLADATNETAVTRLRRKSRPAKPLAVLMADLRGPKESLICRRSGGNWFPQPVNCSSPSTGGNA
jgi:hydrogenase maturation protein HypF